MRMHGSCLHGPCNLHTGVELHNSATGVDLRFRHFPRTSLSVVRWLITLQGKGPRNTALSPCSLSGENPSPRISNLSACKRERVRQKVGGSGGQVEKRSPSTCIPLMHTLNSVDYLVPPAIEILFGLTLSISTLCVSPASMATHRTEKVQSCILISM